MEVRAKTERIAERAKAEYEAVDVFQLVVKEAAYKGQRITLSGVVLNSQKIDGTNHILMYVPSAGNTETGEEILVVYEGAVDGLAKGAQTTLWGVSDGLQITSRAGCCGLTMRPQIKAEILEW